MGFLVAGYCHETDVEARVHMRELSLLNKIPVKGTGTDFFWIETSTSTSGGSGSYMINVVSLTGGSASVSAGGFQNFPVCDVSFENGPMPWGVVSSEASSVWDGVYSLELVGALVLGAWAVLGLAFLARVPWRMFR